MGDIRPALLFVSRKWPPAIGGMETHNHELYKACRERFDVQLFALPGQHNGNPPSATNLLGFSVKTLSCLIFKKYRPNHIYGGDLALWPLIWVAACRNKTAKITISVHGSDISYAFRPGIKSRLYRSYLHIGRRFLRRTNLIANSNATADLTKKMGLENVTVSPLNIRRTKHDHPKTDKAAAPYLLYTGRLTRAKGLLWFIENVLPDLPSAIHLKIAGPIKETDVKNPVEDNRIEFLGVLSAEQLLPKRREALAVIIPNIDMGLEGFEGFGLAAAEATDDSAVVIAADLFGLKDAVQDGKTGFTLPPSDATAWFEKISQIYEWSERERSNFLEKQEQYVLSWGTWEDYAKSLFN